MSYTHMPPGCRTGVEGGNLPGSLSKVTCGPRYLGLAQEFLDTQVALSPPEPGPNSGQKGKAKGVLCGQVGTSPPEAKSRKGAAGPPPTTHAPGAAWVPSGHP